MESLEEIRRMNSKHPAGRLPTCVEDLCARVEALEGELEEVRDALAYYRDGGAASDLAEAGRQLRAVDAENKELREKCENAREPAQEARSEATGPELEAARRVIRAARSFPNKLIMDALDDYDRVTKGRCTDGRP